MATEVFMPQLGLTMTEGTVVRWLRKVGDTVKKGDPIFEVETDKVVQEVASLDEGVLLEVLVEEGKPVPVGSVIAYLGVPGETVAGDGEKAGRAGSLAAGASTEPAAVPSPAAPAEPGFVKASPVAKNLAKKLGVDLGKLQGTGPGGRIVEEDVRRAAEAAAAPAASGSSGPAERVAGEMPTPPSLPPSPKVGERVELRGIRKVVAERMAASFSTAPHFYLTVEVDAGALVALRKQIEGAIQRRCGVELTITDLLVRAAAMALREHPEANAAWVDGGIQMNPRVNVGVAVAVKDGLVVPVIQDADRLAMGDIARKRKELVEKARAGQLSLSDLEGGSFTLTNLGMFGVDQFQAILNPPQAAILATGRIKDRVAVHEGQVVVRPTMFATLSVDHRVVDGALGASFLGRIVELIEKPAEMLLAE